MLARFAFLASVTLALVVGCGDDETPLATACSDEPDLELLNESTFEVVYSACAEASRLANNPGQAATTCLESDPGLSTACASCYGNVYTQCLVDECSEPCDADPTSTACRECSEDNCQPAALDCTGLSRLFPGSPV